MFFIALHEETRQKKENTRKSAHFLPGQTKKISQEMQAVGIVLTNVNGSKPFWGYPIISIQKELYMNIIKMIRRKKSFFLTILLDPLTHNTVEKSKRVRPTHRRTGAKTIWSQILEKDTSKLQ